MSNKIGIRMAFIVLILAVGISASGFVMTETFGQGNVSQPANQTGNQTTNQSTSTAPSEQPSSSGQGSSSGPGY